MTVENDGPSAAAENARRADAQRQADEARRAAQVQQTQDAQLQQKQQETQPVVPVEEPTRVPATPEAQSATRAAAAGEEERRKAEVLRPVTPPQPGEAPRLGVRDEGEKPTTPVAATSTAPATQTPTAPPPAAQAGDKPDGGASQATPSPTAPTAPTTPTSSSSTKAGDGDPSTVDATPSSPLSANERTALRERVKADPAGGAARLREAVDQGRIDSAGAADVLKGNERALAAHLAKPDLKPAERESFARDLAIGAHRAGPETARALGREIAQTAAQDPIGGRATIAALTKAAAEPRGALLGVTTAAQLPPFAAGRNELNAQVARTIDTSTRELAKAVREASPALLNEQRFVATHGAGLGPERTQAGVDALRAENEQKYVALAAAAGPADQLRTAAAEAAKSPDDALSLRAREANAQNKTLDEVRGVFRDTEKALQHANRAAAKGLGTFKSPSAGGAGVPAALTALYNSGSIDEIAKGLGDLGRDTAKIVEGRAGEGATALAKEAGIALGRATAALDLFAGLKSFGAGDNIKGSLQVGAGIATAASTLPAVVASEGLKRLTGLVGVGFSVAQGGYEVYKSGQAERAYRGAEANALRAAGVSGDAATRAARLDSNAPRAIEQIAKDTGRTPAEVYAAITARNDNTGAAVSWLGKHGYDAGGASTVRHDDPRIPGSTLLNGLYADLRRR